jgi:osmotically-inducible protein OsmY
MSRGYYDREYDRERYGRDYDEERNRQDEGYFSGSSSGQGYGRNYESYGSSRDYGDYGRSDDYGRNYGNYGSRSYGQEGFSTSPYSRSQGRESEGRSSGRGQSQGYYGSQGDYGQGRESFRSGAGYRSGQSQGRQQNRGYDYESERRGREEDRGFFERMGDEVRSWFGDEEADRRRRMDDQRQGIDSGRGSEGIMGMFRGRGPKGYRRSDDRIREDINDRLTDNPFIDATEVEALVSNGEVTLTGSVDSRYAKRLAEDIAEEVSGVSHVQNNLRVQTSETSTGAGQQGLTTESTTTQRTRSRSA